MTTHIPVLLEESIALLNVQGSDTILDGTFGGGGHTKKILDTHPDARVISVDLDEAARARFDALFSHEPRAMFVESNFKNVSFITETARNHSFPPPTKVLLDLGTSTFQLLSDTRGFSFTSDSPLQMTFSSKGSHTEFTAYDIVNSWEESSIADIIYSYGEETKARRIAHAIVSAREEKEITTSKELAEVIEQAVKRSGRLHPATKTFQALRIAVNDELQTLQSALHDWWNAIPPSGRIVVITFHSLEDRIVKRWMREQEHSVLLTKKAIQPTKQELQINPRSRSAKVRGIEKK